MRTVVLNHPDPLCGIIEAANEGRQLEAARYYVALCPLTDTIHQIRQTLCMAGCALERFCYAEHALGIPSSLKFFPVGTENEDPPSWKLAFASFRVGIASMTALLC